MNEQTPIEIDEEGHERHPAWVLAGVSRYTTTGVRLFDSEVTHNEVVRVSVKRAVRHRNLNRDWLQGDNWPVIEFDMSMAQWGAFVSSFNHGGGVPATLTFEDGPVPTFPVESRLAESMKDVRNAAGAATEDIAAATKAVEEGFARKAGRKELGALIHTLRCMVDNAPLNMEFAAKSLTKHAEDVVTKAKADIEATALNAARHGGLGAGVPSLELELTEGEDDDLVG